MDEHQTDPLQHFESWNLEALSPAGKNEIRSGLLNAYGVVAIGVGIPRPAEAGAAENAERVYRYVQLAFDAIVRGFFICGVLTEQLLCAGIPEMVSDTLIASGLTRGPSGVLGQYPWGDINFGHYQVPDHHIKALKGLIHPLASRWRARLFEVAAREQPLANDRASVGGLASSLQRRTPEAGLTQDELSGRSGVDNKRIVAQENGSVAFESVDVPNAPSDSRRVTPVESAPGLPPIPPAMTSSAARVVDLFATEEQRNAAIDRATQLRGTSKAVAQWIEVDYSDLRKWARCRRIGSVKGRSTKIQKIEISLSSI